MEIQQGYSYHIKESFFDMIKDDKLMVNKENGNYRPHYYAIQDAKYKGIFWMIPISSQIEKYRRIVEKKKAKYGKCNTIVIGVFAGKENAFLIQNAFPIISKYMDHVHTIENKPVQVHKELNKVLNVYLKEVLAIHKQGIKLLFPDVNRIMNVMKAELRSMMTIYLTSSPGGQYKLDGRRVPTHLNNDNGFVDSLKSHWKENAKVMLISSSPDEIEVNDSIKGIFEQSFPMSGLSIEQINICDSREEKIVTHLEEYDVVILAGGHVPTQNAFFHEIQLKEALIGFAGILIGISAGSMNSAEMVYAQPELEGESVDPDYRRFLPGLGLTNLMILPHYQDVKDDVLDGKRVMEDITYPDSYGREFYAIVDGSYVLIGDGVHTLYGEGYLVKDGTVKQICEKDKSRVIK